MANATKPHDEISHPTLQPVWALIALMFEYLGDPARRRDLQRLQSETEQLLVRLMFEGACRIAGREDLLATHEAYAVSTRRSFHIRVRQKLTALHPYHQIIVRNLRATRIARYRRAIGRRSSFSRKLSYLHFRNQARSHTRIVARHAASVARSSHTPSRISAPP